MSKSVLTLEDVKVHFETGGGLFDEPDVVRAVDGVTINIDEGDVIVLVGESGCGKTTLGKTAIGVQKPTSGSVQYRGQDIWEAHKGKGDIPFSEIRRSLQMIHQDPGSSLNPNRKVESTLMEPLKRWFPGLTQDDRVERIHAMLERVGMTPPGDYADRFPHQLSGGEKQRVALVRALLMNPDVILADEAISALDVSLRIEMMDLMLELQEQFGTAYLAISHDLSNARYFAEKADGYIGIMYLGELVEAGPAEEVLENPQHPYTKALKWATPDLDVDATETEMPVRSIDIPDAKNPPHGCRFHTRCPEATEACQEEQPTLLRVQQGVEHGAACFRVRPDHPYWESPSLEGVDPVATGAAGRNDAEDTPADD